VLPIVVGTRGAMSTSTLESLRENDIKCIQLTDQQEYSQMELKSLQLAAKLLQNDTVHSDTELSVQSCNAVYTNKVP
jgi:ABC-type hemin transport system substrate-binding protein